MQGHRLYSHPGNALGTCLAQAFPDFYTFTHAQLITCIGEGPGSGTTSTLCLYWLEAFIHMWNSLSYLGMELCIHRNIVYVHCMHVHVIRYFYMYNLPILHVYSYILGSCTLYIYIYMYMYIVHVYTCMYNVHVHALHFCVMIQVRQEPERVTHRSSVQLIHALQNISKLNQSLQEVLLCIQYTCTCTFIAWLRSGPFAVQKTFP